MNIKIYMDIFVIYYVSRSLYKINLFIDFKYVVPNWPVKFVKITGTTPSPPNLFEKSKTAFNSI